VNAHQTPTSTYYVLRRKDSFWLLERSEAGTKKPSELALFDTYAKALSRAEALAKEHLPSLLEIHHTANKIEEKYYAGPAATPPLTSASLVSEQAL
jgi:Uncharacterized protein conserved in bacteria (DUF2188)